MKKIKTGSDFSGVGAFDQALMRLGIDQDKMFACDMDKFARQTYIHNYGEPKYYPENVYDREIPKESLDIYMTSPPCQAFSLAGKRKGQDDKRGVLFYNSHEFIQKNKPRYFIFENVKGLLADDKGKTFQRWLDLLGGKTVNGNPVIFPHPESVPYHIYHKVLNAKDFGVPQNRERIFIVGIRDDEDNDFNFPKPIPLIKRLKDVLQKDISEKYYLSEKMKNYLNTRKDNFNSGKINYKGGDDIASCINKSSGAVDISDNIIKEDYTDLSKYYLSDKMLEKIEYNGKKKGVIADLNKGGQKGEVFSSNSDYMSCLTASDYKQPKQVEVQFQLTGGKWDKTHEQSGRVYNVEGISPTIHTMGGGNQEPKIGEPVIGAFRGRNPDNPSDRTTGANLEQTFEVNSQGTSNTITSVQKDNIVLTTKEEGEIINPLKNKTQYGWHFEQGVYDDEGITRSLKSTEGSGNKPKIIVHGSAQKNCAKMENISPCLTNAMGMGGGHIPRMVTYQIRKLTPRECFRLMDFPDSFDFSVVSNTQAYKQAGNSIVVSVLAEIINKLKL